MLVTLKVRVREKREGRGWYRYITVGTGIYIDIYGGKRERERVRVVVTYCPSVHL